MTDNSSEGRVADERTPSRVTPGEDGAADERRVSLPFAPAMIPGIMGGVLFGVGANLLTIVKANSELGSPSTQLLAGLGFSLGLILAVLTGADLFASNVGAATAWFAGRIPTEAILRNSFAVYVGNLIGSVGLVWLIFGTAQYMVAGHAVGRTALEIAAASCSAPFGVALLRGILGSGLICLAVWLSRSGRTITDKVVAMLLPAVAFGAGGFEHCVANMYLVPMGLAINWTQAAGLSDPSLTLGRFLFRNLVPVTIGNVIGAVVTVGGLHWLKHVMPTLHIPRRRVRRGTIREDPEAQVTLAPRERSTRYRPRSTRHRDTED